MFQGYNLGASQARGEILAFVHDDIEVWGNSLCFQRVLETLSDPATGFVGVAGTRSLDACGVWWHVAEASRGMVGHPSFSELGLHWSVWPSAVSDGAAGPRALFGQAVVLDGALLLCHRRTFDALRGFDETGYQGFHFYDIDITFRATLAGLVNFVMPIPVLHHTPGLFDVRWEVNRQQFLDKFKDRLPHHV